MKCHNALLARDLSSVSPVLVPVSLLSKGLRSADIGSRNVWPFFYMRSQHLWLRILAPLSDCNQPATVEDYDIKIYFLTTVN